MTGGPFARRLLGAYPELFAVLVAAAIGLAVPKQLHWFVDRQGINVLLIILVFVTAVTITVGDLGRAMRSSRQLLTSLFVGATVLPGLSWLAARLVAAGPLRNGVLTIGLAPCEIASVATAAMAGGESALAASILIGSTVVSVAIAGPLLILETGQASISTREVVVNLMVVVVVPLVVGIVLRATRGVGRDHERLSGRVATGAVAALVALIASEVELTRSYFSVAVALVLFVAASAIVGGLLAKGEARPIAISLLLTTSMRDFAIAAGIASSAFGAAAAAPLGLYGIIVLVWGTAMAGVLRRRTTSLAG
jgi:predicted Na+-dependent transporter